MAKKNGIDMDGVAEGMDMRADEAESSAPRKAKQGTRQDAASTGEGQSDPQGGDGPGGREWVAVRTDGEVEKRRPRRGDEVRPRCPRCSTDEVAVLCGAQSSTDMVTNYRCPYKHCNFHVPKLRPGVARTLKEQMLFQQRLRQERDRPFVER